MEKGTQVKLTDDFKVEEGLELTIRHFNKVQNFYVVDADTNGNMGGVVNGLYAFSFMFDPESLVRI